MPSGVGEVDGLEVDAAPNASQRPGLRWVFLRRQVHQEEHAVETGRAALHVDPESANARRVAGDLEVVGEEQREVAWAQLACDDQVRDRDEHVPAHRDGQAEAGQGDPDHDDEQVPIAAERVPAVPVETAALALASSETLDR